MWSPFPWLGLECVIQQVKFPQSHLMAVTALAMCMKQKWHQWVELLYKMGAARKLCYLCVWLKGSTTTTCPQNKLAKLPKNEKRNQNLIILIFFIPFDNQTWPYLQRIYFKFKSYWFLLLSVSYCHSCHLVSAPNWVKPINLLLTKIQTTYYY